MTTTAGRPLVCRPLFGTPRSPERPTLGPHMVEVARRLGRPPMPHQAEIYDVVGEIDLETGLLAFDEVVVIGPRQATGKTELVLPVMTYRCTAFDRKLAEWSWREFGLSAAQVPVPGPQQVLYAAQTADDSRNKWRYEHVARLEESPYRRDIHVTLQRNQELIEWRNRSTWKPISTTGKTGGTGWQADMPVLDELWAHSFRTEIALRPTMLTRWWSQQWGLSMIPGASRAAPGTWPFLKHKREVGRARVAAGVRSGMAFFDFCAPEDADPFDERTWWTAMPGLGITVPVRKVRSDFETGDLVDLCAEYLGWEPKASAPRWALIDQAMWERRRDPDSHIAGRPALSLEVSDDRTQGVIGIAGRRVDGQWHGAVAEPGYEIAAGVVGVDWMLRRAVDLARQEQAWTVVVDQSRPAASFIVPLRNAGVDVTTPSQRDVAGACGRWFDAARDAPAEGDEGVRFFHRGQPLLDGSVAAGRKLDVGNGGFVFVKKVGSSEIIGLNSVVLAMFGHELKSKPVPRSKVW